jgi:hypothetical protein
MKRILLMKRYMTITEKRVQKRVLAIDVGVKGIIHPIVMLEHIRGDISWTSYIICPRPDPLHFSHVILFA